GMVLILRWYWWRINAWSELVATIAPFVGMAFAKYVLPGYVPDTFYTNNGDFLFTVLFTTICWLTATFMTSPTDEHTLKAFYERVKPGGFWRFYRGEENNNRLTPFLFVSWLSGVLTVYSVLFFTGYFILEEWSLFFIWFT